MYDTMWMPVLRSPRRRRLLVDLLVTVAFACVIWTYSFTYDGSVDGGARAVQAWEGWDLLVPAMTVLLVGVRRVAPRVVLPALLAVDWYDRANDISSEPFGVAVGLFTIASSRPGRETALAAAGTLAVFVASTQLIGRSSRGFWTCLIVASFGVVAGLAARRSEAHRRRVLRLVAEARVQRRITQQAEERAALALEVHDVCSHSLAVVGRFAEAARSRVDDDPGTARRMLDEVVEVARAGMAEVRRFVRLAESDPVDADLDGLVARIRSAGIPVAASVVGEATDPRVHATVYRVLQEALTNVLRHARPSWVDVEVRYGADGAVSLRVENDGVPDVAARPGRGTRGMAERVRRRGGRLRAAAGRSVGTWSVVASLPSTPDGPGQDSLDHVDDDAPGVTPAAGGVSGVEVGVAGDEVGADDAGAVTR